MVWVFLITSDFDQRKNTQKEMIHLKIPSLICYPPWTNSSLLKKDGWKMNFLLGPGLFSGGKLLVSGRVMVKNNMLCKREVCFMSKNRGTTKWMVYFMEIPMNKWMIWGGKNPYFGNTQITPLHKTGWWFQICFIFTPIPGEMIQFDYIIFFRWVGSTTNQKREVSLEVKDY